MHLLRVIFLTLIFGLIVPSLSDCMFDAREAITGATELTNYDGKVTFDDQGLTGQTPWQYTLSNPNFQEIDPVSGKPTGVQLGGLNAGVSNLMMLLMPGQWVGSSNWLGGSTKPGYFMTITGPSGSGFIDFWPPIHEFSLRAISDGRDYCSMTLLDADQIPFTCYAVPENTNKFNDYGIVKITSYTKQISRIVFDCYGAAIDEIAYKRCSDGYELIDGACIDIDECTETPDICDTVANSTCSNLPGGYECQCNDGFKETDPNVCVDVNECEESQPCSDLATCENTIGSYTCTCKDGYEGSGKGSDGCDDIDECLASPCDPLASCDNTPGSYTCTCPQGYTGEGDGPNSCQDIDECVDNPCNNFAVCQNTFGSYNCTCFLGYTGNGKSADGCTDINECESDPCDENASCDNTPGSYSCVCNDGYEGNGITCAKLNVDPPVFSTPISTPVTLGSTPVETPISAPVASPIGKRPLPQNNSSKIGLSVASLIMILAVILV